MSYDFGELWSTLTKTSGIDSQTTLRWLTTNKVHEQAASGLVAATIKLGLEEEVEHCQRDAAALKQKIRQERTHVS
jgi:hypothetical protein